MEERWLPDGDAAWLLNEATREQANVFYDNAAHIAAAAKSWGLLAELGRADRFFLLTRLCGRPDADRDWIYARCREVERDPWGYLDLWAREHYKALDIDTPIWTTCGWKLHGALRFGDVVFAPSGQKVRVIANTGPMEGADCYDVGGVIAAGDHLWPAQIKHRLRVSGGRDVQYSTEIVCTRGIKELRLANPRPLDGDTLWTAPVAPYDLGVWLGDGNSNDGRVTCGDEELWLHLEWPTTKNAAKYVRNLPGLKPWLRELGVLGNKHVPECYFHGRPTERLGLLQGLMDTDGHVNGRGTATFVNTNERLIDAVHFLAGSLGMRAHKRRYDGYWQVSFQAYQGQYCPFRLSRKRERCKSGIPNMRRYRPKLVATRIVNCIQVQGGQYLAGLNLLPTHNSTVITFAGIIQNIICDPEKVHGLFSFNLTSAVKFVSQIKQEFERNRKLQLCYPEILYEEPAKQAPVWSIEKGITVKRQGNPKETTLTPHGLIEGLPAGPHYDVRWYDDIITENEVTSPEQMEKAMHMWRQSHNLGKMGGTEAAAGTVYHFNDPHSIIRRDNLMKVRIHPATEDGTPTGKPVLLTPEQLREKWERQGAYIFSAQQLLNPVADEAQGFKKDWIKHWQPDLKDENWKGMNLYVTVDPANEKKKHSDYTAIWVLGLASDRNIYVVDAIRDRLNLTERADRLFELHRRYRPISVGYEEYGMQADIQHIQDRMSRENYRFNIQAIGGTTRKEDRIRRLIPLFQQGRIYLPEFLFYRPKDLREVDLVRVFIEQEYLAFPVSVHDDMLDALARIVDPEFPTVWPQSWEEAEPKKPDRYQKRRYGAGAASWMSV